MAEGALGSEPWLGVGVPCSGSGVFSCTPRFLCGLAEKSQPSERETGPRGALGWLSEAREPCVAGRS